MERSSNRRFGLSKEHRRRDTGGVSNRISSAVRCRCNPSNHQPTNPATAAQERERRDPRQHYQEHELPDIFSKQKPATGRSDEHHKSYSTQYAYDIYLTKVGSSTRRSYRLSEVKA